MSLRSSRDTRCEQSTICDFPTCRNGRSREERTQQLAQRLIRRYKRVPTEKNSSSVYICIQCVGTTGKRLLSGSHGRGTVTCFLVKCQGHYCFSAPARCLYQRHVTTSCRPWKVICRRAAGEVLRHTSSHV